jgi:hypothetical protein
MAFTFGVAQQSELQASQQIFLAALDGSNSYAQYAFTVQPGMVAFKRSKAVEETGV